MENLYYFDYNRRVYEINGVKSAAPYHIGYFVPITVVSETEKEIICEYGKINKRSKMYSNGRVKYKIYTEKEMQDEVYIAENRHKIAEKVKSASAEQLRKVAELLGHVKN